MDVYVHSQQGEDPRLVVSCVGREGRLFYPGPYRLKTHLQSFVNLLIKLIGPLVFYTLRI